MVSLDVNRCVYTDSIFLLKTLLAWHVRTKKFYTFNGVKALFPGLTLVTLNRKIRLHRTAAFIFEGSEKAVEKGAIP